MLIKCSLAVSNRHAPDARKCHSTINLCKKKSKDGTYEVFFMVHTMQNKSGSKYMVKGNILQVHKKFVEDGMCTIKMKEPPHDLIISKATVSELKKFIHILKLAFNGQDTPEIAELNPVMKLKTSDLEKPKSSMRILTRSDYPMRSSFPTTLQSLFINQCNLKRFDSRILRLRNLRVLDLAYNKLTNLCDDLHGLSLLTSVTLSNNQFEILPTSVFRCMSLQLLDVSDNQIRFIPHQLSELTELVTFKACRNQIEFLPSRIGMLQKLKILHLHSNKIQLLPCSFSLLHLDELDLSENLFESDSVPQLNQVDLADVASLFELSARFVVKNRIPTDGNLPRFVQHQLNSIKFCPCGNPCLTHCVPYTKLFNLHEVSSSVGYGKIMYGGKAMAKMIDYLCSKACHKKWLENPNTLFTNKEKH